MRCLEPRDLQQEPWLGEYKKEWALNAHARLKMNFTWANQDVKT